MLPASLPRPRCPILIGRNVVGRETVTELVSMLSS